ncbi:MAG TPA: FCD domain-containing protein [Hyphomicrobiales bacterium]|nr:FCD domain-containing protein [Hyphomicrobiales bacterium]
MKDSQEELDDPTALEGGTPRTLAEKIYRQLRTDIVWGRLAPGAQLRSDDLRRTYSIGISPLREALSRLASERLVTASEQRGFRVAPLTVEDVRDTMETRLVLECEALARAIAAGDIAWESRVVASYHLLSRVGVPSGPGPEAELWARYHRDFHMALIAACGSRWQLALAGLLFDQAERHRAVVIMQHATPMGALRDPASEHQRILEAVLARDPAAAAAALDEHYRTTAGRLIELIENHALAGILAGID